MAVPTYDTSVLVVMPGQESSLSVVRPVTPLARVCTELSESCLQSVRSSVRTRWQNFWMMLVLKSVMLEPLSPMLYLWGERIVWKLGWD